jgi:uncharacterized membrane protein YoaK (UPF0700 family)
MSDRQTIVFFLLPLIMSGLGIIIAEAIFRKAHVSFSLRMMLIATMLIAALLWLVVYAASK